MADDYHASQFLPNTRCSPFNCACGSCGMATAFGGGPRLTHDQVRAQSGVSCVPGVDTLSGGLRIADVERVAAAHGVVVDYGRKPDGTYTSWPVITLGLRLVDGYGVIVLGDCQDAPVNPTPGVVLHSAFVHGLDANGRTHWHDPRLSVAYWVTLADVIRYWESFNGSVRYAGFVAPNQAGTPPDTGTQPEPALMLDAVVINQPALGTVVLRQGHQLVNPADPRLHFGPYPADLRLYVYGRLDLSARQPDGEWRPTDIEGNSPPKDNRHQVWLVQNPEFGVAAFALRGDCTELVKL